MLAGRPQRDLLGRSTIIKKGRSTQKDLIDHSPKSKSYLIELLQIAAATENWITCSGLESIVEEMRTSGHDDINFIENKWICTNYPATILVTSFILIMLE